MNSLLEVLVELLRIVGVASALKDPSEVAEGEFLNGYWDLAHVGSGVVEVVVDLIG